MESSAIVLQNFIYEFSYRMGCGSISYMNSVVHVSLSASVEQKQKLRALQEAFAEVCNALAPVVQQTRCWNRVGLHHLAYRQLRERFPKVGSQMVCNAIYSVSRSCRLVYQHASSPFNVVRKLDAPLPLLRFLPSAPVYFDRHTLSLKGQRLSMFTLDGRMRFLTDLADTDLLRFNTQKLREIVLMQIGDVYRLSFFFSAEGEEGGAAVENDGALPEYLLVNPAEEVEGLSSVLGNQASIQRSMLSI